MSPRHLRFLGCLLLCLGLWSLAETPAHAQTTFSDNGSPLPRWYYYPYYYFPHDYWPTMSPKWPEATGQPYQRPPAYMAYPPHLAPNWRYDLFEPMRYYHGFHFWLDQF